ncbi:MAG: right-handed parallel beta-helix repeat-containing protein [Flavicella sp.]|nr:right-handed parallel beta-helix repeat-containing protein [Flavicella sp.]
MNYLNKTTLFLKILLISFYMNSQEVIFYDNFENYSQNQDLLNLSPTLYSSWNANATWNATVSNALGNSSSNGYASSNNLENISFVRYLSLEVGATYSFSVATKITNQSTNWQRNHTIKAQSNSHEYGAVVISSPEDNEWTSSEITFTVLENFENINFSIYRYYQGSEVHIDDFSLRKIAVPNTTTYYIDAENGSDANNGHSEEFAWQSITKINNSTFEPGDQILFKTNQEYFGSLVPPSNGALNNTIIFDKYGTGVHPIINARNYSKCIDASGKENLEFHNLILKNDALEDTTTPEAGAETARYGFYTHVGYSGIQKNILLDSIKIQNIYPNNASGTENTDSYKGYGIYVTSDGTGNSNYYDGITIQNCEITDIGYVGISINKWNPDANPPANMYHKNVVVQNNYMHHIGGSGIVYFNVSDFNITNNLITYTGDSTLDARQHGRGSGFWSVRCKNGILEHNEFSHARGQADSCGAHIDIENDNLIVQYNLSLDNEGGFAEYMGANTNCIYRYNVSINDGWRIKGINGNTQWGKTIWFSDFTGFEDEPRVGSSNNHVYNNTIYVKSGMTARIVIGESVHDNTVKNNIFYVDGTILFEEEDLDWTDETPGYDNLFDTNLWYGSGSYPNIANEIQFNNTAQNEIFNQDPLLTNKGGFSADDYKILENSPIINTGLEIGNNGGYDYWQTLLSAYSPTDIGAHETTYENLSSLRQDSQKIKIFPNPVIDTLIIESTLPEIRYEIYTINGKLVLAGMTIKEIDVTNLKNGLYVLKVEEMKPYQFVKK